MVLSGFTLNHKPALGYGEIQSLISLKPCYSYNNHAFKTLHKSKTWKALAIKMFPAFEKTAYIIDQRQCSWNVRKTAFSLLPMKVFPNTICQFLLLLTLLEIIRYYFLMQYTCHLYCLACKSGLVFNDTTVITKWRNWNNVLMMLECIPQAHQVEIIYKIPACKICSLPNIAILPNRSVVWELSWHMIFHYSGALIRRKKGKY